MVEKEIRIFENTIYMPLLATGPFRLNTKDHNILKDIIINMAGIVTLGAFCINMRFVFAV